MTGKTEEDVVVVCALRTPITKARKGGLKDTPADDLVAAVLKGVLDKTGKTSLIEKKPMKKKTYEKKPKPPIHHRMDAPQTHARHNARSLAKSHLSWRPLSSEFSRLTLKFFPTFFGILLLDSTIRRCSERYW